MKNKLEQQLQQDGKNIKMLAENRLGKLDFKQQILSAIELNKHHSRSKKNWYFGLAAAISLSVLVGSLVQNNTQITHNNKPPTPISSSPIKLNLKQIQLTVEEKINQPLMNEQQAIINDLKMLKKKLLSI